MEPSDNEAISVSTPPNEENQLMAPISNQRISTEENAKTVSYELIS